MTNIIQRIFFSKLTFQLLLVFSLVGCSKSAMYKTGGVIKKIPLAGPIIAAPLEYPQEQENKRIAEENRIRREAEEQRKQAEYDRWFNSLPKEKQVKIRIKEEETRQEQYRVQRENTRQMGEAINNIFRPNTYIVY